MIKTYLLSFLLFGSTLSLLAQTKLIAHKSHSGASATFANSTMIDGLGFGVAPQRLVKTALLDSVIYVSDTIAVMVTSNYCTKVIRMYDREYTMEERMRNAQLWNAGRDTVYNHPLFSKKHQLDSIKTVLDRDYNFNNDADKVAFVGYDNNTPKLKFKKKRSGFLPLVFPEDHRPPFDLYLLVIALALFSLLIGVLSWKLYQFKLLAQKI